MSIASAFRLLRIVRIIKTILRRSGAHDWPVCKLAVKKIHCHCHVILHLYPGDGKGFVVRADEKLTAFVEPEAAIRLFERTVAKKNIALLAAHFAFDGHLRAFRE
jgi:hypothetical protein